MDDGASWDADEVKRHDTHQRDLVKYTLEVIKLLFVLSGGALATCSAFFSDKGALPTTILEPARWAWVLLTAAILLFSVALVVVLARDYLIGERWRAALEKCESWKISIAWDVVAWASGLLGLAAFWWGMTEFGIAAWRYLEHGGALLKPLLP